MCYNVTYMEDTGFKLGQYVINNVGWTNVNNVLTADGTYASSTPVNGQASEFTVGGFLLNVPAGALISGFELEFTGYRGVDTLPGTTLEVWAYDNTNENNAYYQLLPVFTSFNTTVGTFVIGSPTYTFNTILDSNQANNLKFKIIVNGEVYLDSVQVRCFYQPPVENIIITPETCSPLLQAQPFYLETPIGSTDTTCIVNQFVTISGLPITNVDIPDGYPAVLDQGKSNEENIIITNIEFLSGNRRQLTISRGWTDRDPVGQETFLRKQHGNGAELTLSNNIEFYNLFLRKCHIGSLVSAPIKVRDESNEIASYVRDINFVGSGVQATAIPHVGTGGGQDVTVTISGNNTVPPTVNGTSSGTSGNNLVNTLTYNTHAISGINRASLVSVSMSSSAALSGVTLGGSPMTFLGANNNGGVRVEDWVMVNPPLGTQPVVITVAASATSYISSTQATWNGADQTTPFVLGTTNDGSDNNSEGSGTTTVNNSILIHTLATAKPTITYSAGSGESLISTSLSGQVQSGIQTLDVGLPSTQTSVINLSQNATWGNIILTLAPVPVIGDKLVAVTSADTTPSYLSDKVQAGANVTLSVVNPGGNEKLQITSSGGGGGGLTGVSNVGGGTGEVFRDITTGDTINLKTLTSINNTVTITNNTDTIDLSVNASGGTTYGGGYIKTLINDITHGGGYNGKYNSGIQSIYGISNSGWSASSANLHKYDFNNQFLTNSSSATVTATKFNGAQATGYFNGQPNYAVVVGSNVYVLCGDSSNLSFTNRFYFEVYNATTLSYVGATNYISVPGVPAVAGYAACCSNGTNIFVLFGDAGGSSLSNLVVTKINASGLTISINSSSTITGTLTYGLYSSAKNSTNNNICLGGLGNVYDISGSSATIVENVSLPTISGTNNKFLGTGIGANIFIYNETVLEGNSYTLSNLI